MVGCFFFDSAYATLLFLNIVPAGGIGCGSHLTIIIFSYKRILINRDDRFCQAEFRAYRKEVAFD
jgi:hypothetical protein